MSNATTITIPTRRGGMVAPAPLGLGCLFECGEQVDTSVEGTWGAAKIGGDSANGYEVYHSACAEAERLAFEARCDDDGEVFVPCPLDLAEEAREDEEIAAHEAECDRRDVADITVAEPTVVTLSYETAAWWTKVEVPAGVYPICSNGYWVTCMVKGTVLDEYLAPLYHGVAIGPSRKDGIGRETHASVYGGYVHSLIGDVAERDGVAQRGTVTLAPGVEIVLTGWHTVGWGDHEGEGYPHLALRLSTPLRDNA